MQEEHPQTRTHSYTPPIDKLLTYTSSQAEDPFPEISYAEKFGIGPEHIPELIRMATDDYLLSDDANEFELAAPLHAAHALAELHAEVAIEPLLTLYDKFSPQNSDWMHETLIDVFSTFGPAALPSLEHFLVDQSHKEFAQNDITEIIGTIFREYPETRTECVAIFTRKLAEFERNDPDLNAFLVWELLQAKAIEAAPLIQEAFESDCVNEFWCGDWEEAQYQLGLKERPPREERSSIFPTLSTLTPTPAQSTPTPTRPTTSIATTPSHKSTKNPPASKKAKTKMAKASKRANRRKK